MLTNIRMAGWDMTWEHVRVPWTLVVEMLVSRAGGEDAQYSWPCSYSQMHASHALLDQYIMMR